MRAASELRHGMAVRLEGALYKVVTAEYHSGGGKMGGVTHARLRNLDTGHLREWRFRAHPAMPISGRRWTSGYRESNRHSLRSSGELDVPSL